MVGKVVGQREVQVNSRVSVKAPTVSFLAMQGCARRLCMDYFEWMNEENRPFPWGEDQSKYLSP